MKLGRPVYITSSYTMEASVLSEPRKLAALLGQLLLKEQNISADAAVLAQAVQDRLAALTSKLRAQLDNSTFMKGVFYQLRDKREKLDALGLKGKSIIHEDGVLQSEYRELAKGMLNQGAVHAMATKEDVAELVQGVHQEVGAPFQPGNLFERLIEAATPTTWFDEWKALAQAVK
jgi:hypothetical protein